MDLYVMSFWAILIVLSVLAWRRRGRALGIVGSAPHVAQVFALAAINVAGIPSLLKYVATGGLRHGTRSAL